MTVAPQEVLSEIRTLEPFPHVATRILAVSSREDTVPSEITDLIKADPALTAKVLRLCNSAYYGFQREIASLFDAGNLLGVKTLVNLVLTSCGSGYFRKYGAASAADHVARWKSCIVTAFASKLLAEVHGGIDGHRAFTAGLLANIGQIVVDRFLAEQKPALAAALDRGGSLLDSEREVFGIHHAEIGARLAIRWGFPDVLIDTIRTHHAPERATVDPLLTSAVSVAGDIAWAIGLGDGFDGATYSASPEAYEMLRMEPGALAEMTERIEAELARAQDFLEA